MAPLKVLIIGGGIAGPALAYWLSRIDADITLVERSSQMRATGQQVDLRAQGVDMMKKMGIEEAVRAAVVHESGTQLVDLQGRTKAFFPAYESGSGKQSVTSEFEIMRGDLVKILYALTEKRKNVHHIYGTTAETLIQDEKGPGRKVHVAFQDGRNEDFDLVVGADGTGSKTRKMILGPEAPDPRHRTGGYIGYFSVLSKPGDPNRATFCHLPGPRIPRVIGTRKDCPELTRVYMLTNGKDSALDAAYNSKDLSAQKNAWADLYRDGGWECERFMDALQNSPEADDLYYTPFEEVRLPKGAWSKGQIVLLGDAAYCSTAGGFGCSWSLIGAYILAGEIARLLDKDKSSPAVAVTQGAKNYEDIFRPIATSLHGGTQILDSLIFPKSKFGIRLLQAFARMAASLRLEQGVGLTGKAKSWQIPEYPELEREQDGA